MAQTQAEAAAELQNVNQTLQKVATETQSLLDKIAALEAAAGNADVQPELQAAIDAVVAQSKVVDDLVADTVSGKKKK
jgi:uncharacterized iron-regulated protein